MQEAQHTPGPWYVGVMNDCNFIIDRAPRPSNDDIVHAPTVKVIAKVGETREDDANARLLAAAPELLDALEYLLNHPHDAEGINLKAIDKARSAVAKAKAT